MPELKSLFGKTRTVAVTYAGENITVEYIPSRITPAWEREFNELLQDSWKSRAIVETLSGVIISWDLTENGKPFEPTVENISKLPVDFLLEVFTAIMEQSRPNRPNGGTFAGG